MRERILWAAVLGVGLVLGLFALISTGDRGRQEERCRRAAVLNPTISPQQCMELVRKYGEQAFVMIAPEQRH